MEAMAATLLVPLLPLRLLLSLLLLPPQLKLRLVPLLPQPTQ